MTLIIIILGVVLLVVGFAVVAGRSYGRYKLDLAKEPDDDEATHARLEQSNLARYGSYSTQMLTWFSAYGAGLAATIFLKMAPKADSYQLCQLRLALWLIVSGVGVQAFMVLFNKFTQWWAYRTPRERIKWTPWQILNSWLTTFIELDILVDVATVGLLGSATWIVISLTGLHLTD